MLSVNHHCRLFAAVATTVAFSSAAPAASAMPIYDVGFPTAPKRIEVVRVQADNGLDWSDAGLGAAAMLGLVLAGTGGARALSTLRSRERTAVHS